MKSENPFVVPDSTGKIGAARPRQRVVLTGLVVEVAAVQWVGGPVLEAQLRDETGTMCLAFLGRTLIGGIEPGALVTVAGTVGSHRGRAVILNPLTWLLATAGRDARAGVADPVDINAVRGRRNARVANA